MAIHEAEAVTVAEASEAATAAVLMTVVEATDEVAIHEAEAVTVAEASEAATAAVLMTVVEATDNLAVISAATEAVTTDVVRQESHGNHENSANPKARARAMPTTAHHAT